MTIFSTLLSGLSEETDKSGMESVDGWIEMVSHPGHILSSEVNIYRTAGILKISFDNVSLHRL